MSQVRRWAWPLVGVAAVLAVLVTMTVETLLGPSAPAAGSGDRGWFSPGAPSSSVDPPASSLAPSSLAPS